MAGRPLTQYPAMLRALADAVREADTPGRAGASLRRVVELARDATGADVAVLAMAGPGGDVSHRVGAPEERIPTIAASSLHAALGTDLPVVLGETVALRVPTCDAPVMVLAGTMIALESRGPIIYRQERVGRAGRPFTVLKFRSMAQDAEKDGARWAAVNDSRITRVGRLLRRTRIDELPQLLNVIRGEMSFVGPRPERPEFVAMLTEQIPFYAVRHSVKPGLTGWAQVRYSYGATIEQSVKKLEYDLYYVKNHTLFLDLVILLETVRVVLLGEGAR